MQKPYTLIIPSWYPTEKQPLNGIFIQKHVEAISTFQNVIVMYITGDKIKRTDENVISDSHIKFICSYGESASRGLNQLKYIWTQIKAYKHIASKYGRPESFHLHVVFPAGIFVYLLLLFYHIPIIITEHWTGYMEEDGRYKKLPGFARYITSVLFQKAKKISVVSAYFRTIISNLKLADEAKIMIVYNTLNTPASEYIQTEDKTFKALYVGNLIEAHKNISMLINALEIVVEKYPLFRLTMVGGGVEMDKFLRISEEKGLLNKNIFFSGYINNNMLEGIYKAHGFFILTSNFETFNIAAAEAVLNGLPVVSTLCGGPTEFINEKTGIWIEHKTSQSTAEAIFKMINTRNKFDSQKIAAEAKNQFSNSHILNQLKELYRYLKDH